MVNPIGDRILVKRDSDENITAGGIIIPDAYAEKARTGVVLAVGEKRTDIDESIDMGIEVGDKVIFCQNRGTELDINGEDCVILKSYDIFCIVD